MYFDVEEFVHYQVSNAPLRRHPFAHFYVQPVFPQPYYEKLLAELPPSDWYKPIAETETVGALKDDGTVKRTASAYPDRFITDLANIEEREQEAKSGSFWLELSRWLLSERFRVMILRKFSGEITERFGQGAQLATDIDARLVRDFSRFSMGPHTDSPRKLVSLLFYMPRDESLREFGTSIYAPNDPQFRCPGGPHHRPEGFKKVATMPFLPNALFAFFKNDYSFHGVDQQVLDRGVERNMLLYNVYVEGVTDAERAGRWSWRKLKSGS